MPDARCPRAGWSRAEGTSEQRAPERSRRAAGGSEAIANPSPNAHAFGVATSVTFMWQVVVGSSLQTLFIGKRKGLFCFLFFFSSHSKIHFIIRAISAVSVQKNPSSTQQMALLSYLWTIN